MYEYLHVSFLGSYWTECKIIAKGEDHYHIQFKDIVTNEWTERIVNKDCIKYVEPAFHF